MKVAGLRELLLKKICDNSGLHSFVKFCREDILSDLTVEVLEKMARSSHKGEVANFPVRDFATEMDPETEPHMIREALGHHVSHYKAALKANNRALANKHAKQAFKVMNLADRAMSHSNGKLVFEHVSPHAWERHGKLSTYDAGDPKVIEGKYKAGEFKNKTKGLNYDGNDFSFLQQAPHGSRVKEIRTHGHNKAYPFEQMRVNGKYIPVDDDVDVSTGAYVPHHFDHHPVLNHFTQPSGSRSEADDTRYLAERDKFHNEQPHMENFFNDLQAKEKANPEAFAQRGTKPGSPVHPDVAGLDLSGAGAQPTPTASAASAQAPSTIRRPAAGSAPAASAPETSLTDEQRNAIMQVMHPEVRRLTENIPDPKLRDAILMHHLNKLRGK